MNKKNRRAIIVISSVVIKAIKKILNDAKFDVTTESHIISNLGDGSYIVVLNNQEYKVKSETGRTNIKIGSTVRVVIPQNNYSEMFIY